MVVIDLTAGVRFSVFSYSVFNYQLPPTVVVISSTICHPESEGGTSLSEENECRRTPQTRKGKRKEKGPSGKNLDFDFNKKVWKFNSDHNLHYVPLV